MVRKALNIRIVTPSKNISLFYRFTLAIIRDIDILRVSRGGNMKEFKGVWCGYEILQREEYYKTMADKYNPR
jgi:hypothetical protein